MKFAVAIVAVALGWSVEASAHHSTSYFSKELKDVVKIEGRVVRFEWRSPHSEIYVETKGANGDVVVWRFRTTPADWLVREGWTKASRSAGVLLTVGGCPPLGQTYACLVQVHAPRRTEPPA